jgi:hypothetical protein
MQTYGDLIAHRSRRHKDRSLALKYRRRALLQAIDGRVLSIYIIADFG